jgi:septum formation inhibitor-activating ATPase MinD
MQMEQQHKLKLAALHEEKETQVQLCQALKRDLQQQLLYIQQVITQLNDKEACLEGKFQDVVQELTARHVAVLHSSLVHAERNWQL